MAEPVNLNKFRKAKSKAERKLRAARNSARFGQTKEARKLAEARHDLASKTHDQHKIDKPE